MRIKSDERGLLHRVQAGEPIATAAAAVKMNPSRLAYVLKKWTQAGMLDEAQQLTPKGMAADWLHRQADPATNLSSAGQPEPARDTDDSGDIHGRNATDVGSTDNRGEAGDHPGQV